MAARIEALEAALRLSDARIEETEQALRDVFNCKYSSGNPHDIARAALAPEQDK